MIQFHLPPIRQTVKIQSTPTRGRIVIDGVIGRDVVWFVLSAALAHICETRCLNGCLIPPVLYKELYILTNKPRGGLVPMIRVVMGYDDRIHGQDRLNGDGQLHRGVRQHWGLEKRPRQVGPFPSRI